MSSHHWFDPGVDVGRNGRLDLFPGLVDLV